MTCWLCGGEAERDELYGRVGFVRCVNCGFLFAPERSVSELHDLYTDNYFENYPGGAYSDDEQQRRHESRSRLRWISEHVPPSQLLEIGSAAGYFLEMARSAGFEVRGIEPAAGLARQAAERFGLDVAAGFIETAELPPTSVDVVCAWHVLEHLNDPVPSLARLRRTLRPGGRLFLELPNIEGVTAKRHGVDWFHLDPENHVAFYSNDQLDHALRLSGFTLEDVHTVSIHSLLRPGLAVRPTRLAHRLLDTLHERAPQGRSHPTKHELMRAVATVA